MIHNVSTLEDTLLKLVYVLESGLQFTKIWHNGQLTLVGYENFMV